MKVSGSWAQGASRRGVNLTRLPGNEIAVGIGIGVGIAFGFVAAVSARRIPDCTAVPSRFVQLAGTTSG